MNEMGGKPALRGASVDRVAANTKPGLALIGARGRGNRAMAMQGRIYSPYQRLVGEQIRPHSRFQTLND